MSRYRIPSADPTHEVTVGWDGPLETFFGQVHSLTAAEDEDDVLVWVGDDTRAIPTVDALVAAMAPYGTIAPALQATLRQEQATSPPPTPLQMCMRHLVDNVRTIDVLP